MTIPLPSDCVQRMRNGFDRCRSAMAVVDVKASEKAVLLVLSIMANDDGQAWPPIGGPKGLTARCSLSHRAVQGALGKLEAKGHISREQKPGRGVTYTVHPRSICTPAASAPPQEMRPAEGAPTPAASAPKQPLNNHPSTKASPSPKKRARKSAGPIQFVPPEWVPIEPWNGWMEMRDRKGVTTTVRACELAVTNLQKLADDGHPPGDVLDQSTCNSWTGLFPIKDIRNERTGLPASRSDWTGNANGRRSTADAIFAARDKLGFGRNGVGG